MLPQKVHREVCMRKKRCRHHTSSWVEQVSLPTVPSLRWQNTELPATSHLNLQWTTALQLWMREHAWTDTCTRTKKKRKKLCNTPLPPLFPSAHIHSDSSLCSHIAIRGTQLTSTSLTGCLLSFIDCNPANPEVMTEECYCSKVSMKKALWRAGLGGWRGSVDAYRKESAARAKRRQTVLQAWILCIFLNYIWHWEMQAFRCVCVGVCVCGSRFKAYYFMDVSEWNLAGHASYPAALLWCNLLINDE